MGFKTILNPQDVKVTHTGGSTKLEFHFSFNVDLPEGYDFSDYVIIRTKDLDKHKQQKLRVLLQGEFQTSLNRGRDGL